jgi:hypothetical protein
MIQQFKRKFKLTYFAFIERLGVTIKASDCGDSSWVSIIKVAI